MRITVETDSPAEFNIFATAVQFVAARQAEIDMQGSAGVASPPPPSTPADAPPTTEPVAVATNVMDATRVLVERKGLPAAIELLAAFKAKRVSDVPAEQHASYILQATALAQ